MRAFRTLGLQEINAIQFKAMIAKTAPSKRKQIMQVLRQLKGLSVTREKSIQMRRQLDDEDAKAVRQAEISLVDRFFGHRDPPRRRETGTFRGCRRSDLLHLRQRQRAAPPGRVLT